MTVTVAKWGNSQVIRIPRAVIESLNIREGDRLSYEIKNDTVIFKKKQSTRDMFEAFYKKPYEQIVAEEIGGKKELDWGNDIGGEAIE